MYVVALLVSSDIVSQVWKLFSDAGLKPKGNKLLWSQVLDIGRIS